MLRFSGSIANRVFLILLTGILAAAATTSLLADNERRKAFHELADFRAAERVQQIVTAVEKLPPSLRTSILEAGSFGQETRIINAIDDDLVQNDNLYSALQSQLGTSRSISIGKNIQHCFSRPEVKKNDAQLHGLALSLNLSGNFRTTQQDECQLVYIGLNDGKLLKVRLRALRDPPGGLGRPLLNSLLSPYTALFFVLIGLLTFFVARMTARPIRNLANAAVALGNDIDRPPLPENGPREIKVAASAFNAMQARIKRQIQHRTHMLAAITHDLQTPLTRLRLRLEKVSDAELRSKLIDDLAVMQQMIREGLELARSMDSVEPKRLVDLDSIVDSVCNNAIDAGHAVSLSGVTGASVVAQPMALQRCFTNLIDNALKYGHAATVFLAEEPHWFVVRIKDCGPGIPEAELETVFEPFYRLEISRSRDTGGTGLGLSIAKNIVENHGGRLTLMNHPEGGLEVKVQLPARQSMAV